VQISVSLRLAGTARWKVVVPLKIFYPAHAKIIKFASVEGADAVNGSKDGENARN